MTFSRIIRLGSESFKLTVFFAAVFSMIGQVALAIPSPELVIGSVSSLGQVFAVILATLTGSGAFLAKRLGVQPQAKSSGLAIKFALGFLALSLVLGLANLWQYQTHRAAELARMQATLVRPAQFDGTTIQDKNLIETSYSAQERNPLGISTAEAAQLISRPDVTFIDVREDGEFQMGTLAGAQHVRYPDFFDRVKGLENKKVVLFCHNGNRSSETCEKLAAQGIDCNFIIGGIEKWLVEGRSLSDKTITSLTDLRALPDYPNKDTLLTTQQFTTLFHQGNLQIVDTRYPGDFETGHLPGAINIPVRALKSEELAQRIAALQDKPTVAACYDRRSCFMGQVLGLELSKAGIDFVGRYTTPWDFFIPAPLKPHIAAWLEQQNQTLWTRTVDLLAKVFVQVADQTHFLFALFLLALTSRLLVLPIALKSERDQIVSARNRPELDRIKRQLQGDPTRKARAIQQFYSENGMTPVRNLIGLFFLPLMMLGLATVQKAATWAPGQFLWMSLAQPDPTYAIALIFAALAAIYLVWVVAKSKRQAIVWGVIATPLIFALVMQLPAAGNLYLCISLVLLLIQRAYATQDLHRFAAWARGFVTRRRRQPAAGVLDFSNPEALATAGNKAYRLALMSRHGLPVPRGIVLTTTAIDRYASQSTDQQILFADLIWHAVGATPCAVRSSACAEDGDHDSFAGVFDSVLNVTETTMKQALDQVIGSFTSARADGYTGQSQQDHKGNILVQQMVAAEYAGVAFTQDPSAPGVQLIEMVQGCGDDLVSGRVTPITARFGRFSDRPLDDTALPIDLTPLIRLCRDIETLFGAPQDVEWAYAKGRFYILQSRDITTLGRQSDSPVAREWHRLLTAYGASDPDHVILEQDEMSEVLPNPTRLSFDLMASLWQPGGSLDQACRRLGVGYHLPEGKPGHLELVFGRTYVNCALKQKTALALSRAKARQLRKLAPQVRDTYRNTLSDQIVKRAGRWRAIAYQALTLDQQLDCLSELHSDFVHNTYVEAEIINILAGFLMSEAQDLAQNDPEARKRLMSPTLPHAPVQLIAACAAAHGEDRQAALITAMGHRASIDYELSLPRYGEDPAPLLATARAVETLQAPAPLSSENDIVSLAIAFQDLKEHAKHDALRLVAEIRRVCLAIGQRLDLGDLVFELTLDEISALTNQDHAALHARLQKRFDDRQTLLAQPPLPAQLTLTALESFSAPNALAPGSAGGLGGTCVSGTGTISGRVFKVADHAGSDPFEGFQDGDILVCRMLNPEWLPQMIRANGVLTEIGGWLSHMAIVAREKGVMMHVKCTGLDQLTTGQWITLCDDGTILVPDQADQASGAL